MNEPNTRTTGPRPIASLSLVVVPPVSVSSNAGARSPALGDVVAKVSNGEPFGGCALLGARSLEQLVASSNAIAPILSTRAS